MSRYVRGLDGLRGVGIAFVLFYHYFGTAENQALAFAWAWVQMFFVQSGYLITRILLDDKERFAFPDFVRRFYWRRALRIFPAYFATIAMFIACRMLFHVPQDLRRHLPYLLTYTYNFTRLKENFGSPFFMHFWSLAVEEQFYLIWPFVVYFLTPKQLRRTLIAIILLAPAFRYALGQMLLRYGYSPDADSSHTVGEIVYTTTLSQFDGFAFGAAITVFGLTEKIEKPRRWMYASLCLAVLVGLTNHFSLVADGVHSTLASLGLTVGKIEHLQHVWSYSLINALSASAIICVVSADYKGLFNQPFLVWLGKMVYGLYIVHLAILEVAKRICQERNVDLTVGFVVGTAVSIAVAYLSYTYFESRFLRLKDWFVAPVRGSRQASG